MMNSGVHKPPLAPKPKLTEPQRAGLSPATPRREVLSLPSPGTPRRAKPALAPKPCLSKLTTAVESKPLSLKSQCQTPVTETPWSEGHLNSQNGLQQENKKPDWDYIIPICLCSNENCRCIRNKQMVHKGKTEEKEKVFPASPGALDYGGENKNTSFTNTHHTNHKLLQETLTTHKNLNRDVNTVTVRPSLPHRTWSDEANGNVVPQSAPGPGSEEDNLGSKQVSCAPKSKPAGPRKPPPVPVPRKPRMAVLTRQEKVVEEREAIISPEGKDMKVSSDGKGSPSQYVNAPVEKQPVILSARKACPIPAAPPRKKPFLSTPDKTSTSAAQTAAEDVEEEELGWDSSSHEMEVSVDKEDEEVEEKEGRRNQEEAYTDFTRSPPPSSVLHQSELGQSPVSTPTSEDVLVKVAPKKPQRHSTPMAWMHKSQSSEEREDGDPDKRRSLPTEDAVLSERVMRELPPPPTEKKSRNPFPPGAVKPSRSSLGKQRAKSFSSADLQRSEGQKRNSFRKLLDLKLSVKMLPKLIVKGSQSSESVSNGSEQSVDRDQDENEHVLEHVRAGRKYSCPLIGVEQSVDGDEFAPGTEEDAYYENIAHYEEIPDYVNVLVGKAAAPPPAPLSQPPAQQSPLYNDEGIYEEQEPYMSLEKNSGVQQCQTAADSERRNSVDEEVAPLDDAASDDDVLANTSDEEDDSSSVSSKGDPKNPEENPTQSGQKKTKIHHIATEIMSSESVFVDVLKLLHVDFRDVVSKASQSGKPVIEERLLNQILYSLPQLYELNQDLLRELEHRVAKWDENAQLADIFLKKGPYLKMYSTYIREFDKNVALLEEQTKKNVAFGAVVRDFEASPRCANLALKHYLLKPVQRIPQYQLLLTDYLKNLSEDSDDYKDTQAALVIVKEVANHANDIMKQGDNFQKLIQVQCSLNGHHEIVQPGRIFLKEGILKKLSRKVMQPRMFFLFNDTLLYTTPVQSGQYKVNNMLSLAGMKVSKPSQEAYQNELNIESVERSFILSASSAAERDEWLEAISTAISVYTKKKISFISGKPVEEVELSDSDIGAPLGSKAPIWIPDPRTTMCMICTCEFTLTWRRHHCRACGKVVCQSCSSNKYCLEYLKNQLARVCDLCFPVLQQQKSEQALSTALSPRTAFAFSRKQKKIPAALKEVSANTDSSMSGYLQRSKGNKKQWKRLWFVIKDKVLYTYAASEDVAALESQPLLGFMLKADSSQKLQFSLFHKKTLYYIFKADDIQTAQRWIDSFKEATVL